MMYKLFQAYVCFAIANSVLVSSSGYIVENFPKLKLGFQIFFQGIFTICDYCQQIETQKAIARKTAQQAMEVDPNADSDLVEASGTVTIFIWL